MRFLLTFLFAVSVVGLWTYGFLALIMRYSDSFDRRFDQFMDHMEQKWGRNE